MYPPSSSLSLATTGSRSTRTSSSVAYLRQSSRAFQVHIFFEKKRAMAGYRRCSSVTPLLQSLWRWCFCLPVRVGGGGPGASSRDWRRPCGSRMVCRINLRQLGQVAPVLDVVSVLSFRIYWEISVVREATARQWRHWRRRPGNIAGWNIVCPLLDPNCICFVRHNRATGWGTRQWTGRLRSLKIQACAWLLCTV